MAGALARHCKGRLSSTAAACKVSFAVIGAHRAHGLGAVPGTARQKMELDNSCVYGMSRSSPWESMWMLYLLRQSCVLLSL